MKHIMPLLVALALLFGLCACGKTDSSNVQTTDPAMETSKSDKTAPSGELLRTDMEAALEEKHPSAALAGMEITKSMTDENSYDATLTLTAQAKYSDWTYEANVSYTKYDQGWMLDTVRLDEGTYVLMRMPTQEELNSFAGDFLHRACMSSKYKKDLIRESIKFLSDPAMVSNQITVYYETISNYMHGAIIGSHEIVFVYDPIEDQWCPESGEAPEDFYIEGFISDRQIFANFDGIWGSITISDFSKDGFHAAWGDSSAYFTYIGGGWYVSEDGTDASITPGSNWSEINIGQLRDGDTVLKYADANYYAIAQVRDVLPLLP